MTNPNIYVFQAYAEDALSKENCIEHLVSKKVSNESGAAIRCSNAKLIFKANLEHDALEIILDSKRLDSKVINQAKELLNG